ncbi:hypothetical protein Y032_0038g3647 [Ancylostoma ceylanicum]|nr:hypothetical protein Y032_0038g3647 [Ancylostoma ceylanicum]
MLCELRCSIAVRTSTTSAAIKSLLELLNHHNKEEKNFIIKIGEKLFHSSQDVSAGIWAYGYTKRVSLVIKNDAMHHNFEEFSKAADAEMQLQNKKILSNERVITVLNSCNDPQRNANCLVFFSGMREVGEILEGASENAGRKRRQVTKEIEYHHKWLDGVVNYIFNDSTSQTVRKCFLKAAEAWQKETCITFTQGKADTGYLVVNDEGVYYSHVGRLGDEQPISLDRSTCTEEIGRAIHEIGHALGLYHTQSRYDRDSYLNVNLLKIKEPYRVEFGIIPENETDLYEAKYDYGSIMHYAAVIEDPAMIPNDKKYLRTMGSQMFSFTDLWLINEFYGCHEKCKQGPHLECDNGGFPHARKCNEECTCPSGYGGKQCKIRPEQCGDERNATDKWQYLDIDIKNSIGSEEYAKCYYWIRSPPGTVIEVKIAQMSEFSAEGCWKAGVEIKTNKDQTLTGYRFCSEDDEETEILRSHSHLVPIIAYNKKFFTFMAKLQYRFVDAAKQTGV